MILHEVIAKLYLSEINVCVSTFWDQGVRVSLGDAMNGWHDEAVFYDENEIVVSQTSSMCNVMGVAAIWLHKAAVNRYPGSAYARESRNKEN